MTYDFATQLAIGQAGERALDEFFSDRWIIIPATPAEQRAEIDRWFEDDDERVSVEYKADHWGARTGNAFIETVSVDRTRKLGWAYTSLAQTLMYWVVDRQIYIVQLEDLRAALPDWRRDYREKESPNKGYQTRGLVVPLPELRRVALEVIDGPAWPAGAPRR